MRVGAVVEELLNIHLLEDFGKAEDALLCRRRHPSPHRSAKSGGSVRRGLNGGVPAWTEGIPGMLAFGNKSEG